MKKKYIWFFEILIWLMVISASFYFFIYNNTVKESAKNTYYIFFDDVSGLIKGSPVKLMGINIGHVQDVKIFDNKVFVSFIVTKENIKIPNKALANIEFYGLGGSTSLELAPDNQITEGEGLIIPSKTYKVQDFWDGQELVANVMIDIYGGIGRSIQAADLINNKQWFKQSKLVEDFSKQAGIINNAESVIIYKLSESTLEYTNKKLQELQNEEEHE